MMAEEKGASPSEVVEKSSTLHTASFTPHPRGSGLSGEKQIEEMYNDLNKIFDEEYRERRIITAYHTAKGLYEQGYRKQSEWISVEERLPDEQGRFLIVDKEGQMNTAFYTPRFGWFSHFRIKNITHWMPLPEAPKGGAE